MTSFAIEVGPGLSFRFEGLASELSREIELYLSGFESHGSSLEGDPLCIAAAAPPPLPPSSTTLTLDSVTVRQHGSITRLEIPGVVGWCDAESGDGGIEVRGASAGALRDFTHLALAPLLIEMAGARGWLGVHAAAVAWQGHGILLPGPSGCGKSTLFRHARDRGFDVLSDDLVWLRSRGAGFRLWAFPRGLHEAPMPTLSGDVPLSALVCPSIAGRGEHLLVALEPADAIARLVREGGFLSCGAGMAERFRALVRVASSVPCYRLEAGPDPSTVPPLLARLVAPAA